MKILIAGGGKIGSCLTEQLTNEGHELTVIDCSTGVLEDMMEKYDVITVAGNAASMSVLETAGVKDADLFIAATDMDEVNMLACMTAHGLNPKLTTIGRIRNPEYRTQAYEMRDVFGLTMAVNPEKQAAHEIARLLNFPGFLSVDSFAKGNVEIVELKVDAKNPLNGTKMSKLQDTVHSQVLVCAVLRNGQAIMPDGNFVIRENDQLFITATPTNLTQMLKNLGIIAKKAKRVLIAGGGRISYYLVKELEKSGMDCTIMESNVDRCHELAEILPECTVIHGDASSQEFLDMEGVGDSDAVVTLTGLDELNIVISLYANTRNVSQVVTKLSHAENNKILDSLKIGAIISPKELAGYSILRYVRAMQNQEGSAVSVHRIAGGKFEALEFKADKTTKHCGEPLRNVKTKNNALIASIFSHGKVDIPSGNSKFMEGDTVIVVTTADENVYDLNDIFED